MTTLEKCPKCGQYLVYHSYTLCFEATNYNLEDLCLWPDGTYCLYEDLEDYLTMMSDDFEIIDMDDPRAMAAQGLDENGLELDRNDNLGVYDSDYN